MIRLRPVTIISRARPRQEITLGEMGGLAATSGTGGGYTPESFEGGPARGRESRGVVLEDGRILATYHGAGETGDEVEIQRMEGGTIRGEVIRHHGRADLALIDPEIPIAESYGRVALAGRPDLTPPGSSLTLIGPDWRTYTLEVLEWIAERELLLSVPPGLNHGWSGCPVVDDEGFLEGIVISSPRDRSHTTVAGEAQIIEFLSDSWTHPKRRTP